MVSYTSYESNFHDRSHTEMTCTIFVSQYNSEGDIDILPTLTTVANNERQCTFDMWFGLDKI